MPKNGSSARATGSKEVLAQLRQKENEQAILLCVAARIATARNRNDLWNIINEDILGLFNGVYYTLCLLHEEEQTHSPFLYSRQQAGKKISPVLHKEHPVNDGIFDAALAAPGPLIFRMADLMARKHKPSYIPHWHKMGIRSLMVVKIANRNEHKGVLYLYGEKASSFHTGQSGLLTGIADLLGTGMCNVLANEQIEQQMEEIERYKQQLEEENHYLLEEQRSGGGFSNLVGESKEIQKVYRLVSQVAPSGATVLLLGETGTGKELVARAIHEASPRREKLMIKVNCAAIPASLIESELFGHEKGSFTGALDRRIGKFELANNSTIFLDEIGELPQELQSKLLRALQEKEIERVGGKTTIKVNVRIIAATNKQLETEVAANRFRSDLYYRLNVFPIHLPPLRKRKEDIPALVSYFIERFARQSGKKINNISHKALEKLMGYSWPGNVRELEHLVERAVLLTNTTTIRDIQLPERSHLLHTANMKDLQVRPLADVERDYILKVVKLSGGRISGPNGAALKLQLPATTLISKMQKLGIKKEHFIDGQETGVL
ncbi:sigma-54-dependent Fis family transcriptional regulator [Chitinophaga japonensis]|uniref:Transcriptional regulator with GAF, ATPase, and Fis domain n=1 Tax=Chitinophaga japonensis TaxID=104662 RepID=A0A562SZN5_CHIJA|nr:sigma 54-interacting transcriptional regulator [Chitinophaga japonensis]TWI86749.1 transcriptional regulator with GAF, ATPase, and Fis domain [Chitinophaga japonensis]